ncbi:hypothetical protein ACJ72_03346 [Emergomyces africanus]|uniref:Uncharacterized protein n=1 Tax=Emergomyces africanus TaxID=1955775 RepID=A0A1B7NZV7_9EURO|nr:hypothetical protein ACJ72_03346 [Emergomyces africanus]
MRFTNASLLGLLVAVAPLATIAQTELPVDTTAACALLANLTPEQFATVLADLANTAAGDLTQDQAEVQEAVAQINSLPVDNLQAEVDRICAAQGKAPAMIRRSRISRRQDLGGVGNALPGGLGNTVKGVTDTIGNTLGGLSGTGNLVGRDQIARRQDLGGLGGTVGGLTGGGLWVGRVGRAGRRAGRRVGRRAAFWVAFSSQVFFKTRV